MMSKYVIKIDSAKYGIKYLTAKDRLGMTIYQAQIFKTKENAENFIEHCSTRIREKEILKSEVEIIEVDENLIQIDKTPESQSISLTVKQFDYSVMMSNLNKLIDRCETYIKPIKSKEDLLDRSLRDVFNITSQARELQRDMDQFVKSDLYHILGMAPMSMMQQYMFIDRTKEFLSYRPYIKSIASYVVPEVPGIPDKTSYDCRILGVHLSSNLGE